MSNNKCVVDAALFETLQNVGPKELDGVLDNATHDVLVDLGSALKGYGLEHERGNYRPIVDVLRAEIKRLLADQLSNNGKV
jgi:hypothetical protein